MISQTYPDEYLDIDFLSEILFDYTYGSDSSSSRCYELDQIDRKNIKIDDIKLIPDKQKQKQLINNVLNANVTWLWRKKNLYMFKRQMNVYSTNIQLKLITESEQSSLKSSENINSLVTWLLSDLVVTKKTKGILLNLMSFDVSLDLLVDFIDNFPEVYADFVDIPDKKSKLINITVMEHFFKTDILSEIVNDLTWQQIESIIFQVAHVLSLVQKSFPGFRKNNLTLDTIMLYNKKPKSNIYKIGDQSITMSDEGYEVKLGFFSDTYIPEYVENDGIPDSKKTLDNTYDLLMFLNDLVAKVQDKDIKDNIKNIYENIEKNSKNIILSNIIMNTSFLSINKQKGGKDKTAKNRTIKGVRYLSNSDSVFLKSESRNIQDLPDSLSSLDSAEAKGSNKYKFDEKIDMNQMNQMNQMQQMNQIQQIQGMGNMGMPMPMGSMGLPQVNPMGMGMSMAGLPQVNPMAMGARSMYGNESMNGDMAGLSMGSNAQVTNDQLVKLGIMAPATAMANLPRSAADTMNTYSQMGGSNSSEQYIDINGTKKSDFFF